MRTTGPAPHGDPNTEELRHPWTLFGRAAVVAGYRAAVVAGYLITYW